MCGSFLAFNLNFFFFFLFFCFLFVYFGHNFCRLVGTHRCCSIAVVGVALVAVVATILFDMHYQLSSFFISSTTSPFWH